VSEVEELAGFCDAGGFFRFFGGLATGSPSTLGASGAEEVDAMGAESEAVGVEEM
jgi:hypothetical protein